MGNDINKDPTYNSEIYTSIKIKLNKICYYPSEFITGQITLSSGPRIETHFSDPSINFTITQFQKYKYGEDSFISQNDDVLIKSIYFNEYTGANLSANLNIPFSIQLPENIAPTCLIRSTDYCKHYLTVNIPSIQAKKTLIIIIKNNKNFLNENKLTKSPTTTFLEKRKKSFLVNKGRIAGFLKIPKNSFNFNEEIPLEITLDCSEFDLKVQGIKISIIRKIKVFDQKQSHVLAREFCTVSSKQHLFNENQECYVINESIKFLNSSENKSVYPPAVYQLIEQQNQNDLINKIHNYTLCPVTKEGRIHIGYYLNVKILIDTLLTFDESLEIPINFYSLPEGENVIYQNKNKNNSDDNNLNHISEVNDNSISPISDSKSNFTDTNVNGDYSSQPIQRNEDKNDLNKINDVDFEIIDQNDFYDILTNKKDIINKIKND